MKRLRDAGAIIIGKANMGEYASGFRSSFGGTIINAYDTERNPGGSSGGSAVAVAMNLCTVAIAEETGPSVRAPAEYANTVGLAPGANRYAVRVLNKQLFANFRCSFAASTG